MQAERVDLKSFWQKVECPKKLPDTPEVLTAQERIRQASLIIAENKRIIDSHDRYSRIIANQEYQNYLEEHKRQLLENVEEFVRRGKSPVFPPFSNKMVYPIPETIPDNVPIDIHWVRHNTLQISHEGTLYHNIVLYFSPEEYHSLKERVEAEQQRIPQVSYDMLPRDVIANLK